MSTIPIRLARAGMPVLLAAAAWSTTSSAWAQAEPTPGSTPDEIRTPPNYDPFRYRSDQFGAVELRFGRYVPNIDDEFDGAATPYETVFGDDTRFFGGLEVDWQILRIPGVGTLGPGIGWAYTRSSGLAPLANEPGLSAQKTVLWIMPMYLSAVLRMDVFMRKWQIPLVPYGKFGLSYALWSSTDGNGRLDRADGVAGRGSETGLQFALGGMFWLNALHPQAALDMDNATGINNAYVFFEWFVSDVDSFGGGMQVGTNTWVTGLALEF